MGISEKRVSATNSRQKVIARAARVSENENPIEVFRKMFISQRKGGVDGVTSRGEVTKCKRVNTSKELHCSMVRTRGGLVTSPTPPPRVFTTDKGVKVRKVNGGFRYQPPALRVISYLALSIDLEDRVPISKLSKEVVEGLIRKMQNQNDNSGIQRSWLLMLWNLLLLLTKIILWVTEYRSNLFQTNLLRNQVVWRLSLMILVQVQRVKP